jgi:hypothetical protein
MHGMSGISIVGSYHEMQQRLLKSTRKGLGQYNFGGSFRVVYGAAAEARCI